MKELVRPGMIRTPDPLLRRQTDLTHSSYAFHIFHGLTATQGTCFCSNYNPLRFSQLNFATFWAPRMHANEVVGIEGQ